MKAHRLLALGGLVALVAVSCTPLRMMKKLNSGKPFCRTGTEASVRFELKSHAIVVPAHFSGDSSDHALMFDTGAMTFVGQATADRLDYEKCGAIPTFDKSTEASLARFASISVGDAEVRDLVAVIFDLHKFTGFRDADGLLGSDFLRFFTVGVDYQTQTVTFSLKPAPLESSGNGFILPIRTPPPLRAPLVKCTIDYSVGVEAMIDTGSPYALVLPLTYLDKVRPAEQIESVGKMARWPQSKVDRAVLSRVQRFNIGPLTVHDLPVIYADQPLILLGKAFLDRFRITIDYPQSRVLFQPVDGREFEHNVFSTGIGMVRDSSDRVVVRGFWQKSPCAESGIAVGDEIVAMNGAPTGERELWQLAQTLNDTSVAVLDLELRRDGQSVRVQMNKRNLLSETN